MGDRRFKKHECEIPYEMVEDILARLSLKKLMQFRCVCRRWGRLIVDEQFMEKRKTHAPRKFLSVDNKEGRLISINYHHGRDGKPKMIVEEVDLIGKDNTLVNAHVVGHCNGLFCLWLYSGDLALWNPCLRQLRRMVSICSNYFILINLIGFGYDHSIHDYKIIVSPPMTPMNRITTLAEVFTLKSGSRVIDLHSKGYFHTYAGTLLGRYIFWLANPNLKTTFILRFDLMLETFKELSCPPRDTFITFQCLGVVNGKLCIFHRQENKRENNIVIWNCDEQTDVFNTESWNIWFIVPIDNLGIPDRLLSYNFPKHNAKHTELLVRMNYIAVLRFHSKLFTCNLEESTIVEVKTDMILHTFADELHEYVETLVSPFGL